jgi:hypothetical protein
VSVPVELPVEEITSGSGSPPIQTIWSVPIEPAPTELMTTCEAEVVVEQMLPFNEPETMTWYQEVVPMDPEGGSYIDKTAPLTLVQGPKGPLVEICQA